MTQTMQRLPEPEIAALIERPDPNLSVERKREIADALQPGSGDFFVALDRIVRRATRAEYRYVQALLGLDQIGGTFPLESEAA